MKTNHLFTRINTTIQNTTTKHKNDNKNLNKTFKFKLPCFMTTVYCHRILPLKCKSKRRYVSTKTKVTPINNKMFCLRHRKHVMKTA